MSKQKTILLSLLAFVLLSVVGFYVYQKNNSGLKTLTKEEIEAQQRADPGSATYQSKSCYAT